MDKKTIRDLNRATVEEYHSTEKLPLVVVLDNVRSLNNIGSMFRTADAFLVNRIVLCGISQTPPSVEIHKTALGAEDSVDWQYFESTLDAVAALRAEGYRICALEQAKGSIELERFDVKRDGHGYALIMGHEVDGVAQEVVDACDYCIELPQFGTKHSLNVAVTAGIAMWHFFTALKFGK